MNERAEGRLSYPKTAMSSRYVPQHLDVCLLIPQPRGALVARESGVQRARRGIPLGIIGETTSGIYGLGSRHPVLRILGVRAELDSLTGKSPRLVMKDPLKRGSRAAWRRSRRFRLR